MTFSSLVLCTNEIRRASPIAHEWQALGRAKAFQSFARQCPTAVSPPELQHKAKKSHGTLFNQTIIGNHRYSEAIGNRL
jgi:hypothetical protein